MGFCSKYHFASNLGPLAPPRETGGCRKFAPCHTTPGPLSKCRIGSGASRVTPHVDLNAIVLICAVASLISLILSPRTRIYASFYSCIGRMYSNALLASLNARTIIRGRITGVDSNPLHHINVKASRNGSASVAATRRLSRDVFVRLRPGDIEIDVVSTAGAGDEPLAVRIDRRTEMYADGDGSYTVVTGRIKEPDSAA
ncbi:hypothetical protein R3P38DRAFT_2805162 [Favolaschia claudopus]|uniref:DUF6534 domain-containing protein n=1 Tax=Favolaschia claudopus TaxID=2862362 RepID=A0AAV9ZNV7_9AGAR